MTTLYPEIAITLSNDIKLSLINYAKSNSHKYSDHGCMFSIGVKDNNITAELLQKLKYKPIMKTILITKPNVVIPPHIDTYPDPYSRSSCVSWALSPDLKEFAPTLFYNEKDEVIYTHKYTSNGFILNTKLRHGMVNNTYERFLFQLTYTKRPEILAESLVLK
jgi:hypothetical protein